MSDDGEPQICDFGCSKIIDRRGFTTKFQGSERWMAPELTHIPEDLDAEDPEDMDGTEVLNTMLTKASDVYAFAMVALEVRWRYYCETLINAYNYLRL
jgi:serine/threonine protein kinase